MKKFNDKVKDSFIKQLMKTVLKNTEVYFDVTTQFLSTISKRLLMPVLKYFEIIFNTHRSLHIAQFTDGNPVVSRLTSF